MPKEEERERKIKEKEKKDFLLEMRIVQLSGWTISGTRPRRFVVMSLCKGGLRKNARRHRERERERERGRN